MRSNEKAILVTCPSTRKPILTGLFANKESFLNSVIENRKIRCPHCGETHAWSKKDAHLAGSKA